MVDVFSSNQVSSENGVFFYNKILSKRLGKEEGNWPHKNSSKV